jgi:hypothetical protein
VKKKTGRESFQQTGEMTNTNEIDDWALFAYGHVAIARWTDAQGERRVYLIARGDGLFSFWGEYFCKDPEEMCWLPDNVRGVRTIQKKRR